ncbi:hypothetical protein ACFY84_25840 [Streptomyces sp. NPDC012438]|uniref:hypothetical protein n=1 Tax=Streptomyces sp. NPDC012438 TaxID=3364833 RepID=UPI0036EC23AF
MTIYAPSTAALLLLRHRAPAPRLAAVSAPFRALAHEMVTALPQLPERTAGLRKLLEVKDCAVLAALDTPAVDVLEPAE